VLFPPVAVVAVIGAGIEPKQMVCDVLVMVLLVMGVFMFIATAAEVSVIGLETTYLLNHVFCVNTPGE
jgi:hypothetical protein